LIKSKRIGKLMHVSFMGEMRNGYEILVRKSGKTRSVRSYRRRWEDNVEIDLK
jgi:hypothetical protein